MALVALWVPQAVGHQTLAQPFVRNFLGPLAFAQEQDVGLHVRRGDARERTLRQADRAQQLGL